MLEPKRMDIVWIVKIFPFFFLAISLVNLRVSFQIEVGFPESGVWG